MKNIVDELDRSQDILREVRDNINKGFKDFREDQDYLSSKNGVLNVDEYKSMDINSEGSMMFVNSYTLTQIKRMMLEALFSAWWDKRPPKGRNVRVFLDINPKCFRAVVDYLNEPKIAPPYCSL